MKIRALHVLFLCSFLLPSIRAAETSVTYPPKSGPGNGKHIVFIAGDEEYRSEEALPMLAKILSQRQGFKCTVLFSVDADGTINPDNIKSLSNPEVLDTADAIVMSQRFRAWPDETLARFDKYLQSGKPIIAMRTSTHAFNSIPKDSPWAKWNYGNKGGFGKLVLGETWVNHWARHKIEATRGIIEPSAKEDPILHGVTDVFGDSDVYEAYPPADAKILLRGQALKGMNPTDAPADYKKKRATDKQEQGINDPMMPVAWTRLYKNDSGKVNHIFCTTMGAATDYLNEDLRRLLVNAVFWGLDLPIPAKANVTFVDDYQPKQYGATIYGAEKYSARDFRRGLKASDHALGKVLPPGDPKPVQAPADAPAAAKPQASVTPTPAPVVKGDDLLKPKPRGPRPPLAESKIPLEFIKGERVAFVGGSFSERMNLFGNFETLLHSRFPDRDLIVRNFSRPADEVGIRQRPTDYAKLDDPLYAFGPDTFLCFFGYNESFSGPAGVEKFKEDYEKFIDEYTRKYPRDNAGLAPRFVIISPAAFEATGQQFMPEPKGMNANLKLYTQAAADVARKRGLAFVDLYTPTETLFAQKPGMQFTINGAHLNESGDKEVALVLDRALFGGTNPAKPGSAAYEKLRAAVIDKSWVHSQDYRMLNGWYVYGGRRTFDTETFPREYLKIRNMVDVRDHYVADIAHGKAVATRPDDSQTGELFVPPTTFGTRTTYSEPKELKYLSPEESMATMTVPEGFQVQLVASERDFPQLAKPDQINFDSKGRLWASCMPTYPQWKPGDPRPSDRLLIFDDLDANGKARKCTVFYDKLSCPTGFEFWNGGVLVVDEPRLIFLKDTDGDDKADVVIDLIDGWATDDTHHTIGAFEYSNGGLLHMLEGVSLSTAVETPWGPLRRKNLPGCYVLDPLSQKVRHYVTPGYGNPWCYVFNWWGQGIVGDGTTPQQHWDTPLSGAEFNGRKGLNTVFNGEGMRPNVGTEFLYSRHFPDNVQGQFIYACVINMNGLTRFEIKEDGSGYTGGRLKKTVDGKLVPNDLLVSTDKSFRPTDPQFGPDGALYFGDWHTALLGHMQYSQRDPNRDHQHGRIYRLINKDKPLLKPVTQFGKSVPALLDQLKEYEPRTRYRARRELRDRNTKEVVAAVKTWVAKLDARDAQYDHHMAEALWVLQGLHAVDIDLLKKVLRAKTGDARAAATRVLADEWEFIPNAMAMLKPQVTDEFPRTRAEAVRALSFVPTLESVDNVLLAANLPRDYWLDYIYYSTLTALEPVWKPALRSGTFASGNPKGREMLEDMVQKISPDQLAASAALKSLLSGGNLAARDYQRGYADIAKAKGNAANGKTIFARICIACHKIGTEGVDYGPDLTVVGTRLKREDIVESVIEPNAKMDPKYQTTNVETKAGDAFTGFVTSETADTVTMKIAGGLTKEFKKADLSSRQTLKQSSMPEGLANGMSSGEFVDLMTYLASLREAGK